MCCATGLQVASGYRDVTATVNLRNVESLRQNLRFSCNEYRAGMDSMVSWGAATMSQLGCSLALLLRNVDNFMLTTNE